MSILCSQGKTDRAYRQRISTWNESFTFTRARYYQSRETGPQTAGLKALSREFFEPRKTIVDALRYEKLRKFLDQAVVNNTQICSTLDASVAFVDDRRDPIDAPRPYNHRGEGLDIGLYLLDAAQLHGHLCKGVRAIYGLIL
jgi:hypothetical protein